MKRAKAVNVWVPALLAVIAAAGLYFGIADQPFQAPDLQLIEQSSDASRRLPMSRVWLAPLPPDRPDLGVYRPVHGLFLKFMYRYWPVNARAFHIASILLFAALCGLAAAFVARVVGRQSNFMWPAVLAALAFAAHPMATESVNWAWAHHALLAGIGWVGALLVYQLWLERKIRLGLAAPLVGLGYFVAAGSFEVGLLLPLALIALHLFSERPEKADESGETRKTGIAAIAALLLIAGGALIGLRMVALDGGVFPSSGMSDLAGAGIVARIGHSAALAGEGIFKAFIPWRPTFFYSARYEQALPLSAGLGAMALAIYAASIVIAMKRNRTIALGLVLAGIPMVAALQILPLVQVFSERVVLFALPGAAIVIGALVGEAMKRSNNAQVVAFASAAILLLPYGAMTMWRNHEWSDSSRLWQSEAQQHPAHPGPLTNRLIDLVSRSRGQFDLEAIASTAEKALELAKPPDADLVYQYLVLVQLERRDPDKLRTAIAGALEAPPPHGRGYFATLGAAAYRAGMPEVAEVPLKKELESNPDHFGALYALAEVQLASRQLDDAARNARRASENAPPHMESEAFTLRGLVARALGQTQEAQAAFTKAIELDRTRVGPYLALARLMVDEQQYEQAERVLTQARSEAAVSSFRDIYAVQVESLERRGNQTRVFDFIREMSRTYSWDMPFQLYAARYYLEHRQTRPAREIYNRLATGINAHPAVVSEALVGLGKIVLLESGNPKLAEQQWMLALARNPNNAEARQLLAELKRRESEGEFPAAGEGPQP